MQKAKAPGPSRDLGGDLSCPSAALGRSQVKGAAPEDSSPSISGFKLQDRRPCLNLGPEHPRYTTRGHPTSCPHGRRLHANVQRERNTHTHTHTHTHRVGGENPEVGSAETQAETEKGEGREDRVGAERMGGRVGGEGQRISRETTACEAQQRLRARLGVPHPFLDLPLPLQRA